MIALVLLLIGVAVAGFVVPGKGEREQAVGKTSDLPKNMQRAFSDTGEFSAVPEPGPADWLSCHKEDGQSYHRYLKSKPNKPGAGRSKLYIQPLGVFAKDKSPSIDALREYTEAYYYPMTVVVLPAIQPRGMRSRENGGKEQWLTTDLLNLLQKRLPADAYSMLGITMTDLYPDPKWNFVFGQARLRARVGVFSFARYHPSFHGDSGDDKEVVKKLMLKRAAKVLTHETGHMFGVRHCVHYHCNMNGANNLAEADATPMHLCPVCLRKMQHVIGFDPVARYQKLLAFYQKHGLKEEEKWTAARIKKITGEK
ncbi:MAG: archaemetzincin [Akkermansiaceae bacterium]